MTSIFCFNFTGPSFHFHNPHFYREQSRSLRYIGGSLAEDLSRQFQFQLGTNRTVATEVGRFPTHLDPKPGNVKG